MAASLSEAIIRLRLYHRHTRAGTYPVSERFYCTQRQSLLKTAVSYRLSRSNPGRSCSPAGERRSQAAAWRERQP